LIGRFRRRPENGGARTSRQTSASRPHQQAAPTDRGARRSASVVL